MVDRMKRQEILDDLRQDLREGRIIEAEFRWGAIKLGISNKEIEEDLVVFKYKKEG